jgi:K+-transporting ATPase ATPase A chain
VSDTLAGILFLLALIVALAVCHKPLGDYMYRVYDRKTHSRPERLIYRLIGVNADNEQTWGQYARSVLAFSLLSVIFVYVLERTQHWLLLGLGMKNVPAPLAWNTAISFMTNTNWQNYSGESTLGYLVQMAGLAVQNFVSAAVGMAVAIALVRGFARRRTGHLGNFWVDLIRGSIRILLPIAFIGAIILIAGGAIENFHSFETVKTIAGLRQTIPGGPVAGQEAIKELGNNGGGFFNANSAHPFENPTAWTNWFEIFLILLINFSLPRTFGRMVGSNKQGYAIVSVMAILYVVCTGLIMYFQIIHHGTVPMSIGHSYEGVEQRFGVPNSATFAGSTTLTSTGAVDSFHDSYTSLGGMVVMFDMMLGEVAPGGAGAGLYGMLLLAVLTVFISGLMVGRTPEYLGKKLGGREMKFASIYIIFTPLCVLVGAGLAIALPGERAVMTNTGAHGFSEILYAFTSMANNNGSAFAGLGSDTAWYNVAGGLVMFFARLTPMIFVLALGGSLAQQGYTPPSAGTLPTHRPQFIGMVAAVAIVVVALTYLPALALGPLAEGIH